MGLLDKVKAGAGQAIDKAKEEAKELQLKRELNNAFEDLGKAAFDRIESGEVTAPGLGDRAERVRSLKAQLAALQAGEAPKAGDGSAETPTGGGTGAGAV